jgi:hypothetical protein
MLGRSDICLGGGGRIAMDKVSLEPRVQCSKTANGRLATS